jgi:hypothetical protein
MRPSYALARANPGKPGPKPHLEDPAYRSRIIAVAASGMSRRGVAAVAGVSIDTLNDWLARGRARPGEEPYGSFARDYLQAERGIELAVMGTTAAIVAQLYRLAMEGQWAALNESPHLKELGKLLRDRYPEDWGISVHRKPEQEPDGNAWLERHALTGEQLEELFRRPPEPVQQALIAAADDVYALLLASGWTPKSV